jgi:hypothetical protein
MGGGKKRKQEVDVQRIATPASELVDRSFLHGLREAAIFAKRLLEAQSPQGWARFSLRSIFGFSEFL